MTQLLGDLKASGTHTLGPQQTRTVGGTHEGTGHDASEAHLLGLGGHLDKLLGVDPAVDRVVQGRGTQVLRERQQVTTRLVQVAHGGTDFLARLAHTQDQIRLRDHAAVVGTPDHRKRTIIVKGGANLLEDTRHRLQVVREDLRAGLDHHVNRLGLTAEVVDEELHARPRVELVDEAAGLGIEPRRAVGQIVSGHARDRHVAQVQVSHRLSNTARLILVVLGGAARRDVAEVAATRAQGTAEQERRLAVLPAFVDVGAAGLCAHRVQPLGVRQGAHVLVVLAGLRGRTNPLRLLLDRRLRVTHLDAQELASFGIGQGTHSVDLVV